MPGVVYGHQADNVPIVVDTHEFQRTYLRAGRTHLVDLVIDDGKASKVLIKEVQNHPRWLAPIHVDLQVVNLKEKLHVDVPVVIVGESPIVKVGEADLQVNLHTLRVECLPSDIPEAIEVDVTGLTEVDAAIRVSDLKFPDNVTVLADGEELVVKAAPRRDMAAELDAEVAAEAAAEAPEEVAEEGAEGPEASAEESGGQKSEQ